MTISHRSLQLGLVAVWTAAVFAQTPSVVAQTPNWIAGPDMAVGGRTYFRKELELAKPVQSARLVAAAHDAGFDFYLDGKLALELDPYDPLVKRDLTQEFSPGKHVVAVRCRHSGPNAMFFIRVQLKLEDGTHKTLVTDSSWRSLMSGCSYPTAVASI
jgi:hypothetical protein